MDTWVGHAGVLTGVVVSTAVRWPHARRNARVPIAAHRKGARETALLTLAVAGMMVVPLVAVFTPLLAFADYAPLPGQVWAGWVVLLAGLWLFWRAHADLGTNWSPTLEVRVTHTLVTRGVYRRVRHPMYAAIWLWGVGQALLLPNWVAGPSVLWSFLPMYLLRVPREEAMMRDAFGDEYRAYAARTGRVLPKFRRGG
jgi:protein-S-isoprenylcysteine O-methyltransferase Ste14